MEVSAIKSRAAAILIVEASSGVRPSMTEAFRELGFSNIRSVDSLTEALTVLAAEPIDWLITSLFPEDKTNALHILDIAKNDPGLQKLNTSLFVAEAERSFLPKAFALGLFTCHDKPFNKDSFRSQIETVLKSLGDNQWNATLTSAEYLRSVLKATNRYPELLQVEHALCQAFPKLLGPQMHLAEAQFLVGNSPAARALLWQIEQRDPNMSKWVG